MIAKKIEHGRLQSAEGEVQIRPIQHGAGKVVGARRVRHGHAIHHGPAGHGVAEHLGHFVHAFARRVVHAAPDNAPPEVLRLMDEHRVPARRHQVYERKRRVIMDEKIRVGMGLDVIYSDERNVQQVGKRSPDRPASSAPRSPRPGPGPHR